MNYPRLYPPTAAAWDTNGLGALSDCISCVVEETLNGPFELEMQYRLNGLHYADITLRSIILAKPNPTARLQPFRVYKISRPINGVVTINAQHLSYDLSGIVIEPFNALSLASALEGMKTNAVTENPFEYETDKTVISDFVVSYPSSARSLVAGQRGSLLDTYGGELEFDRYQVKIWAHRGKDNGVTIRYGKNMTDVNQEEDGSGVYTGVYPYWYSEEEGSADLGSSYVPVEGEFDFTRILLLDLTEEFENKPTAEELTQKAQEYISNHDPGVPTISTTVSWYQSKDFVENVNLGDVVGVYFSRLGISAKAKIVKTRYNALQNRYESVDIGSVRSSIAGTIVSMDQWVSSVTQYTVTETRRITKELEMTADSLRSAISDSAQNTTQLIQQSQAIIMEALQEYATTGDLEQLRSSMQSRFEILAGQIEASFTSISETVSDLDGETTRQFSEIHSFIRLMAQTSTVNGGIVIGESTSQIKLKLENDILYFFAGDEKTVSVNNAIAYFSAGKLYVVQSQIQQLTIGTTGRLMDFYILGSGENTAVGMIGRLT
nr:MAG TPA: tail protein [Caudoviricetes sp.]